ncbi:MAG: acyltransferase family protein [Lachnospiraceae bacterium]|nr:acyltransferase family protein [Lachnospiraceae bacterium]
MTNQRYDWLDQLKGIAMIFIVLGHVTASKAMPHVIFCYSFHIPLFFMISGITAKIHRNRHPETEFIPRFIWTKIKQLVIPYFLLNIVFLPIYYLNFAVIRGKSVSILNLIIGMFYSNQDRIKAPTDATWFLLTLFLAEIVFDLLERVLKRDSTKLLIAGIGLGLLSYVDSISGKHILYPWHIQAVPMAVFFIALGYWFMENKDRVVKTFDIIFKNIFLRVLCLLIIFAAGTFLALKNGKVSMPGSQYQSIILFIIVYFCLAGVLTYISIWMKPLWIFKFIGKNTIFYMAAQCVILSTLTGLFPWASWLVKNCPYAMAIILIIILIPLSMFINKFLPFLVGKKYKKRGH